MLIVPKSCPSNVLGTSRWSFTFERFPLHLIYLLPTFDDIFAFFKLMFDDITVRFRFFKNALLNNTFFYNFVRNRTTKMECENALNVYDIIS